MSENNDAYAVTVPRDLEDLVPMFLSNRQKDIEAIRSAIAGSDFEQLRQIGHRMKGSGRSYGFGVVSDLGRRLEEWAAKSDIAGAEALLAEYTDYMSKVVIGYE